VPRLRPSIKSDTSEIGFLPIVLALFAFGLALISYLG
jgi:hypothetical protein